MFNSVIQSNTFKIVKGQGQYLAALGQRLSFWGLPLALTGKFVYNDIYTYVTFTAGLWMIYPALTPSFKRSIGLLPKNV